MALGAAVPLAISLIPKSISLRESSESRAKKVVPSVVASALTGNLTAFRALYERRSIGVEAERKVWAGGYQQVVTTKPNMLNDFLRLKNLVPLVDQKSPESAAQSALGNPYSAPGTPTPETVGPGGAQEDPQAPAKPALSAASQLSTGVIGNAPLWLILVVAGGIGWLAFKAVRK